MVSAILKRTKPSNISRSESSKCFLISLYSLERMVECFEYLIASESICFFSSSVAGGFYKLRQLKLSNIVSYKAAYGFAEYLLVLWIEVFIAN